MIYNDEPVNVHPFGGGLVAAKAKVADTVFIGKFVRVSGDVEITGTATITGDARVKVKKIFYVFYEVDQYLVQADSLVAAGTIVDKILGPGCYRLEEVVFPTDHIFLLE